MSDATVATPREGVASAPRPKIDGRVLRAARTRERIINATIDFLIIAFAIFLVVKAVNSMKKKPAEAAPAAPPAPSNEEKLLAEIRDLLRNK